VCAVLTGKPTHKAQNPRFPCFPRTRPPVRAYDHAQCIYGSRDTRSRYPRALGFCDHNSDVALAPVKESGKGINSTNQGRMPFDRDLVEFDELK
jgi:hypothetical protein